MAIAGRNGRPGGGADTARRVLLHSIMINASVAEGMSRLEASAEHFKFVVTLSGAKLRKALEAAEDARAERIWAGGV